MLSSLNSGVTGLQQFQDQMDVIGNNVANVNTVGYKAARVEFADAFSQTLRGGSASTDSLQVGTGVTTSSIQNLFSQGTINTTGVPTDAAISGAGFFVVRDSSAGAQYATRDGQFHLDDNGYLVTQTGLRVQGYADSALSARGDIQLDATTQIANHVATATTAVNTALTAKTAADAAAAAPSARQTTAQNLADLLTTAANALAAAAANPNDATLATAANTAVTNADTAINNADTAARAAAAAAPTDTNLASAATQLDALKNSSATFKAAATAATTSKATTDFATAKADADTINAVALTNLNNAKLAAEPFTTAATAAAEKLAQANADLDAAKNATISSYDLDTDGKINVHLSDGTSFVGGQILLQNFRNPTALTKEGNNLLSGLSAAGPLDQTAAPNTNGLGKIQSGALELSNVDLAGEFSSLITTQRAFQASARIITTSDEILQELINLKR